MSEQVQNSEVIVNEGVETVITPAEVETAVQNPLVAELLTSAATIATATTRKVRGTNGPAKLEFCRTWVKCHKEHGDNGLTKFCEQTGMSKQSASQRATTYRAEGIKLPVYDKGGPRGPRQTADEINALLDAMDDVPTQTEVGQAE